MKYSITTKHFLIILVFHILMLSNIMMARAAEPLKHYQDWAATTVVNQHNIGVAITQETGHTQSAYKDAFLMLTCTPKTTDSLTLSISFTDGDLPEDAFYKIHYQIDTGEIEEGALEYRTKRSMDFHWLKTDTSLPELMMKGTKLTIGFISNEDKKSYVQFSLMGFTKAGKEMLTACDNASVGFSESTAKPGFIESKGYKTSGKSF